MKTNAAGAAWVDEVMKFYKRFPKHWRDGTHGMPADLQAIYNAVIDEIILQDGPAEIDVPTFAKMFGTNARYVNPRLNALVSCGKLRRDLDGKWHNKRAEKEVEKVLKSHNQNQTTATTTPVVGRKTTTVVVAETPTKSTKQPLYAHARAHANLHRIEQPAAAASSISAAQRAASKVVGPFSTAQIGEDSAPPDFASFAVEGGPLNRAISEVALSAAQPFDEDEADRDYRDSPHYRRLMAGGLKH